MNLDLLLEEFETSLKTDGTGREVYVEVFKDPTTKEFMASAKEFLNTKYIRFIALMNGTLYVFRPDVFHDDVWDHLKEKKIVNERTNPGLWGSAKLKDKKWIYDGADRSVPNRFKWGVLEQKGIYREKDTTGGSVDPKSVGDAIKNLAGKSNIYNEEIDEAFEAGFTHYITKEHEEIFVDPTAKEMNEVAEKMGGKTYLRFIADGDAKKLYVFSPMVLHRSAAKEIKSYYSTGNIGLPKSNDLWGVAVRTRSGWQVITSDVIEGFQEMRDDVLEQDWSWLNGRIDVSPLLDKIKSDQDVSSKKLEPANIRKKAKKKKVDEAFEAAFTHPKSKEYVEIFSNPTAKEMNEAAKVVEGSTYIRFIADANNKRLFVFSPLVIHRAAALEIKRYSGKGLRILPSKKDIWGVAKKVGGSWQAITFDVADDSNERKKAILEEDWTWLNKKIDITSLLDKIKKGQTISSKSLEPAALIQKKTKKVDEAFKSLAEEFVGRKKTTWGDQVEIFVDPTVKEMRELPNNLRYAIDGRTSKIRTYVWDANLLHEDAAKAIDIPYPHEEILYGIGKKAGNKVISRGGIYPARQILGKWKFMQERQLPKKYGSKMKEIEKRVKGYLSKKWNTKWVDLSDFHEAIKEMFKGKLDEAFATGARGHRGKYYEVFKNPTAKELKEIPEVVRFLIDARGNKVDAYVWDSELLHVTVAGKLGIPYPPDPIEPIIYGIGDNKGTGKIEGVSDLISSEIDDIEDLLNANYEKKAATKARYLRRVFNRRFDNPYVDISEIRDEVKMFLKDNNLNEAFATGIKRTNKYYEVFKNPTAKEIQELPEDVRFLVDARKGEPDVYVWPANLLHSNVAVELDLPYPPAPPVAMIYGAGEKKGGKIMATDSFHIVEMMDYGAAQFANKRPKRGNEVAEELKLYLSPKFENNYVILSSLHKEIRGFFNTYDLKLNEAFEMYAGKGEDAIIFKNPTASEMRELGYYLRFIIRNRDNKNDVYVFSDGLMHSKAADELGIDYPNNPSILAGIAVRRGKDWMMMDSFNLRSVLRKSTKSYIDMLETNWSNPYIKVEDYMAKQSKKKRK